jgi:hypothetical protein
LPPFTTIVWEEIAKRKREEIAGGNNIIFDNM